mgnify:FL=1
MMKKILIAGFQHETNTFGATKAQFKDFEEADSWPALLSDNEVLSGTEHINLPISGFVEALRGDANFPLVPVVWASAEPSSFVTDDAFNRISKMILSGIRRNPGISGIYLDLHGAMVTESFQDGEGELLRRIREVVGNEIPIVISLDLHANITGQMVLLSSGISIYRTYPHIDMAETGGRAATLLKHLLTGKILFKAFRQVPFLITLPAQHTGASPCRGLYSLLPDGLESGHLSCDIAMGFPPADIFDAGPSVVAFGSDQNEANLAADTLIEYFQEHREEFNVKMLSAEDAAKAAISHEGSKSVVIADVQDNPGAGAPSDTTQILKSLLDAKATNAVLGLINDPEVAALAHKTGLGNNFSANLGGKSGLPNMGSLEGCFRVQALSDGIFDFTGAMYHGAKAQIGPMALLEVVADDCDIQVVVGSKRCQCLDQAIFTHLGVDLATKKIIALKSTVHFRGDFESLADLIIIAEAPGANFCRLDEIPYTNLRPELLATIRPSTDPNPSQ